LKPGGDLGCGGKLDGLALPVTAIGPRYRPSLLEHRAEWNSGASVHPGASTAAASPRPSLRVVPKRTLRNQSLTAMGVVGRYCVQHGSHPRSKGETAPAILDRDLDVSA
jgi:hypothetical protein